MDASNASGAGACARPRRPRRLEETGARALAGGKPEKIEDKLVEGRLNKFYEEVCLVTRFVRFKSGDQTGRRALARRDRGLKPVAARCRARHNRLPVVVFNLNVPGNIMRVVLGEPVGTLVG